MSNRVDEFRKTTDNLFRIIEGYSARELEQLFAEELNQFIEENNLQVKILDVVLSGSRCRRLENENSDIDFIVSFSGQEREDWLYNLFNEMELGINGKRVDINPISVEKTGTLEDYLYEVEQYLANKML